ncbi:reverse transcriptase [Quillaja saponaria]|uniref:Reverse transcriptase n=1 Tax=Quillaja saponaria TaxID=32244 RepID=A0AAD7M3K2_QUISA|nr:reverse transcriptase [Quillaja saponaria]
MEVEGDSNMEEDSGNESEDDLEDNDFDDREDCLVIRLTMEEKRRLRLPWRHSLIIKLLGKRIRYNFFCKKLYQIWKPIGVLKVIDIGNHFFLIRFSKKEDMEVVVQGGPWLVLDHYLTLRCWRPNFNPFTTKNDCVAVWVRFLGIPMEYHDSKFLTKFAQHIGKPIKGDTTTSRMNRDNFAIMRIKINLSKPLVSKDRLRK